VCGLVYTPRHADKLRTTLLATIWVIIVLCACVWNLRPRCFRTYTRVFVYIALAYGPLCALPPSPCRSPACV
jgi:hypothetical protein